MEYPKTEEDAISQLEGSWRLENTNVAFKINGTRMEEITSIKDNFGNACTELDFSIRFSTPYWEVTNSIFGMNATITKWDKNSFTTEYFPVVFSGKNSDKIVQIFIRLPE